MTHLLLHKTPNLVSSEPGAAHTATASTKEKRHLVVLLSMHGHLPDEVELDEILRITSKVVALIDSEKASLDAELEPKRKAFVDMLKAKGLTVHALERGATELP
jgi:hypothetical protein